MTIDLAANLFEKSSKFTEKNIHSPAKYIHQCGSAFVLPAQVMSKDTGETQLNEMVINAEEKAIVLHIH